MSADDSLDYSLIERLAEEFAERRRRGEHPTVQEYLDRHPDLAAAIREVFPALLELEKLDDAATGPNRLAEADAATPLERLGEFRIVREIGRGGMGVVYEAVQESLGRRVALKCLAEKLHPHDLARERFEREARAAARLHHTNIVPVHGFGEHEGTLYYVMQLIDGQGLDDVLDELRRLRQAGRPGSETAAYARRVAEIGAQVADALEYAHRQGVVHRDVKPSNVLIDLAGTAWVTDFGLARVTDDPRLTEPGDLVGTLRYMPPEAFDGKADHRGDIYSLGLTLYELLAFRPAFDASDRARLIQQATEAAPPRLGRLAPGVPRDLATIIHKAIERDPAHRYQSPGEMAADLRRFLDDEPIRARPMSGLELALRWARRNRALAASLTTAAVLLVALTAGSVGFALYYRDAAGREKELRQTADARAENLRHNLYGYEMRHLGDVARSPFGLARIAEALPRWRDDLPDLRGWEWYYLHAPFAREALVISGLRSSASLSPDGTRVVAVTQSGKVQVYDSATGQPAAPALEPWRPVQYVLWSPDGSRIAGFNEQGMVYVWNVANWKLTIDRQVDSELWRGYVSWSPQGGRLAVATGTDFQVWDAAGKTVATLPADQGSRTMLWGHDGRRLVAGDRVWDVGGRDGKELFALEPFSTPLAWSPDGKRLAVFRSGVTGKEDDLSLLDGTTGKPALKLDRKGIASAAAWSPDGSRLAVTGGVDFLGVWETDKGKFQGALPGPGNTLRGEVAWSRDGKELVCASDMGVVKVWRAGGAIQLPVPSAPWSVAWDRRGGRVFTSHSDGTVRAWALPGGCEEVFIPQPNGFIESVAWGPDSRRLAVPSYDGRVRIFSADDARELLSFAAGSDPVTAVHWSADGSLLATGATDRATFVDPNFQPKGPPAGRLPDGRFPVRLWEPATGKEVRSLGGHARGVLAVAFSPDGARLASSGGDDLVHVWDVATGAEAMTCRGHFAEVRSLAWSPDGRRLLTAAQDGAVRVFDPGTGEQELGVEVPPGPPADVTERALRNRAVGQAGWSPDGARFAVAEQRWTQRVWGAGDGTQAFACRGHAGNVAALAWHPEGGRLATAGSDGMLRFWDAADGLEVFTLALGGAAGCNFLAWSPDGTRLAWSVYKGVTVHDAIGGYAVEAGDRPEETDDPVRLRRAVRILRHRAQRASLGGRPEEAKDLEARAAAVEARLWPGKNVP